MKPTKGNIAFPQEHTDKDFYILGYQNAILEVSKDNASVAIRSVKYSFHKESKDFRKDAEPTPETRITILIQGEWEQHFWTKEDTSDREIFKLTTPGEYLVWPPEYWHTWRPVQNSTMLTVSLFVPKFAFNQV